MSEYTVKEQSKPTLKLEDDLDVMYDVTPNIVEIKVRILKIICVDKEPLTIFYPFFC